MGALSPGRGLTASKATAVPLMFVVAPIIINPRYHQYRDDCSRHYTALKSWASEMIMEANQLFGKQTEGNFARLWLITRYYGYHLTHHHCYRQPCY